MGAFIYEVKDWHGIYEHGTNHYPVVEAPFCGANGKLAPFFCSIKLFACAAVVLYFQKLFLEVFLLCILTCVLEQVVGGSNGRVSETSVDALKILFGVERVRSVFSVPSVDEKIFSYVSGSLNPLSYW